MSTIITIGREFGSGGRELGRRLAEALGIDYYDREIVTEISKETDLSVEYVRQVVERKPHNLYPITVGQSMNYAGNYAFQQVQSVYRAQCEIIRKLAEKGDCVIVGRCADHILRDMKPFRIFAYADIESRVKRCMDRNEGGEAISEKKMKKHIRRVDKERAKYYEFYTGAKWGDRKNYDLCINLTNGDIKNAIVPALAKLFQK